MMNTTDLLTRHSVGNRGGRLTKWRGKVASLAPGLVMGPVVAVAFALPLAAQTISGEETTTQSIAANAPAQVTATGSVTVVESTDAAAIEFAPNYSAAFTNDGSISATITTANGSGEAVALSFHGTVEGEAIVNAGSLTAAATGTL